MISRKTKSLQESKFSRKKYCTHTDNNVIAVNNFVADSGYYFILFLST
jgi:hypothetical protein